MRGKLYFKSTTIVNKSHWVIVHNNKHYSIDNINKLARCEEKQIVEFTVVDEENSIASIILNENLMPVLVDWEEELNKCLKSPYYFYTNYMKVKTKEGIIDLKLKLTEEEFNEKYLNNLIQQER